MRMYLRHGRVFEELNLYILALDITRLYVVLKALMKVVDFRCNFISPKIV